MDFVLLTGFIEHLLLISAGNYNSFIDLHTLKITTSNIKASMSALGVAR
jgi:hypothetical protein